MTQKIRFGILSTANIAKVVSNAMHQSDYAAPLAVASRDLQKAEAFARENNIPRAYDSYDALLSDPDIDAIYLPLPTNLRTEWAIKSANAKKHVLVEKPLASAQDVRRMRQACSDNGVHFMVLSNL
jgi:predicted dehydrogenase